MADDTVTLKLNVELFDYIAEANLTLSNKFHGDKVTMAEFRAALDDCINAANRLDRIKKALFYGKGDDIGLTQSPGAVTCMSATDNLVNDHHSLEEHQRAEIIIHGIVGLFTEAGELVEALRSAVFAGGFDEVNALEELGDGMWYQAILLKALGSNFGEVQQVNIAKLRKRFPNNFTEYDAQHRNLDAERAVLEQGHRFDRPEPAVPAELRPAPVGTQEHGEVMRAAGFTSEGDGGEHGAVMDAIRGG